MTCPRCQGSVLELQDVWFSYGNRPVLEGVTLKDGILADIAPTLLNLLGVEPPEEMTGACLVQRG